MVGGANQRGTRRSEAADVGWDEVKDDDWLVVWNIWNTFPEILGISWSQLTNSYFSEGLKPPTRWWCGDGDGDDDGDDAAADDGDDDGDGDGD